MENSTESDSTEEIYPDVRWSYGLAGFLFLCLTAAETGNALLQYNISMNKLSFMNAKLLKAISFCGIMKSIFLIIPAGVTCITGYWVFERTGCVYQNLMLQIFVVANRLLLLVLILKQISILRHKRGPRATRSSLTAILLAVVALAVFISSLSIIQEDKFFTKMKVYTCLLPVTWLTVSYELLSCIIPYACLFTMSVYALNYRRNVRTNETDTVEEQQKDIVSSNASESTSIIVCVEIPLSILCICGSLTRLISSLLNFDPLTLVTSLMFDTFACVIQPWFLIWASPLLRNEIIQQVKRRHIFKSATDFAGQSDLSNNSGDNQLEVNENVNDVQSSVSSIKEDTQSARSLSNITMYAMNLSNLHRRSLQECFQSSNEGVADAKQISVTTDDGVRRISADSTIIRVGSNIGLYGYVSQCDSSSIGIPECSDKFSREKRQSFSFHTMNKGFRIINPYRHTDYSTTRKYQRPSVSKDQPIDVVKRNRIVHLYGKDDTDLEQTMPKVQVDSMPFTSRHHAISFTSNSSSMFRLGSDLPAIQTKSSSGNRSEAERAESGEQYERNLKKESDTGELVIRKY